MTTDRAEPPAGAAGAVSAHVHAAPSHATSSGRPAEDPSGRGAAATGHRVDACDACLRRTALVAALSGRIEHEWRLRRSRPQLLALSDERLLDWANDAAAVAAYAAFDPAAARAALADARAGAVCRCSARYPAGLAELADPPAVLHVRGDLSVLERPGVALVGARRASAVGLEVARSLGRGLAVAGVPVVSGMALGVDAAAHAGALDGGGPTVAVLATGADRPYPARHATLHGRIATAGCVVSELPPGTAPRRWAFPARNRVIAALAAVTVVVEGGERSGSLITADFAADLGRVVAAVPGTVTSSLAAGPNALLQAGAELVRDTADVLDLLAGTPPPASLIQVLGRGDPVTAPPAAVPVPEDLDPRTREVLERVEAGDDTLAALVARAEDAYALAADLGVLEARGLLRRLPDGRYLRALR